MFRRHCIKLMSNFNFKPSLQTSSFQPSVWLEFSPLSIQYKAVNLGQGFPDFEPPKFVTDALIESVEKGGLNQYARSAGHLRLVNAISKMYSPLFKREIDPLTEIVTTVGASEGIFATIQSVVSPGDEVILIEPYFDIYTGAILMAGGIPKYVTLRENRQKGQGRSSADWKLDMNELQQAFTEKTKLLLLNNPHNPVGKVYSKQELEEIANIVRKHPSAMVISDEVYEWLVFDQNKHERFATLPDMYERTITIGSAGKTFSITGWKIGWCIGPKPILKAIANTHQYIPFSTPNPAQEAVAISIEKAQSIGYFEEFKSSYQKKRDKLVNTLTQAGFDPVVPQGAYFVLGDTSKIQLNGEDGKNTSITGMGKHLRDWNMCRWLTTEIGVAAIPPSAFYSEDHQHQSANYARFCFCKKDEVLDKAHENLLKIKSHPNSQNNN
ncbi:kynurenine-oxoglutarate transaminase [Tieghemostelium lacteum]|uniref:kynurenine--oxoglutarate transaminase n=1 Tax=Tieghemostelium lacteum TaxID=361077 RepID=A0A151ZDJ6_TIELA|nr:kynurenine-oxoglutarate transaminase [Tieghemostelium lacteum]|eukprot:KYQ92011.1 kynurenine-oxoglutarate transaminase [Tieghemostelium lacteum]